MKLEMQQRNMNMIFRRSVPGKRKTNTKTMKMKTQNAKKTPVNTTQKMNHSIMAQMKYQVPWMRNIVDSLRKAYSPGNENVIYHRRFVYIQQ